MQFTIGPRLLSWVLCLAGLIPVASYAQQSAAMPFEMGKPGLDIGIVVRDLDKSKQFYGDAFGLKLLPELAFELPGGGQMVRYQAGASIIKLRTYPNTPASVEQGVMNANGIRVIALFIEDADAVAQRLEKRGLGKLQLGPAQPGGFRFGYVSDPDGNQVEVITFGENPPPRIYERFQIGLTVADVEKSREFYGKVLGLIERPAVQLPPAIAVDTMQYNFIAGLSTVKFWSPKTQRPTRTGAINAAVGLRYFTFIVQDVDATYKALQSRGVTFATEPFNLGSVARIFIVTDPDGNAIEFAGPISQ